MLPVSSGYSPHCSVNMSLRWRHNDHDGVSNHQPHGCLLNRLFRRRSKKASKLRVTCLCAGNSLGPVNSPHKWPVTRKMFQFDDVVMYFWDDNIGKLLANMLSHWSRDKMAAIWTRDICKYIFVYENCCILIKSSVTYVHKGPIYI